MNDISYFDFKCEQLSFDRKYLHYLHPSRLAIVMAVTQDKKKKEICSDIDKLKIYTHFQITPSRLSNLTREIRIQLMHLRKYATLFDVDSSIKSKPLKELENIVTTYIQELE